MNIDLLWYDRIQNMNLGRVKIQPKTMCNIVDDVDDVWGSGTC